jgi:uncharacterized coiled-coil protein SlyX
MAKGNKIESGEIADAPGVIAANSPKLFREVEAGQTLGTGGLLNDEKRAIIETWIRENERVGRMAQAVEYIRLLFMAVDNQNDVIEQLMGDVVEGEQSVERLQEQVKQLTARVKPNG